MNEDELLTLAAQSAELAKRKGAQAASVSAYRAREVEWVWRDGKIEKVQEATTKEISLALFVDGRFASMSSSDLRPDALSAFVEGAVRMARVLAPDASRGLPDPSRYQDRSTADLEVFDAKVSVLSPEQRKDWLRAMEAGARESKGHDRVVSVTCTVRDTTSSSARVNTNGFAGTMSGTSLSLETSSTVKDNDDRRPEEWSYAEVRQLADLPHPSGIGRDATERALARIGATKLPSSKTRVLVDARAAGRLLRALIDPMTGRAVQQKQSFLEGKLGKEVGGKLLTLRDEPLLRRGLASRTYDQEGMSTKTRSMLRDGKLESLYLDVYYANKLKMMPTLGRPSNMVLVPGTATKGELLAKLGDGFLITSFLGGNSNNTTGDYSLGVGGFRVRKGAVAEPISEMNISGNQLDLWRRLAVVGGDPYPYASIRTPSLLFDGLSVAGT